MKAYWGSRGIAPCILDLTIRWRRMVTFKPRLRCSHGKSHWYPSDRRAGGLQNRSGHGGEDKNSQPLPGLEPPDRPARSPVLYRWDIPAHVKVTARKRTWNAINRKTVGLILLLYFGKVNQRCSRIWICFSFMSRNSSVGIALGYRLDDWGPRIRFPAGAENFSLHHRV
jgi:hypothetical protein